MPFKPHFETPPAPRQANSRRVPQRYAWDETLGLALAYPGEWVAIYEQDGNNSNYNARYVAARVSNLRTTAAQRGIKIETATRTFDDGVARGYARVV